jgi:hypothetical protein
MTDRKTTRMISARIDADLYSIIERASVEETRSISHQVEHLLKLAVAVENQTKAKDPLTIIREAFEQYKTPKKKAP